jgi:hypothetical protein
MDVLLTKRSGSGTNRGFRSVDNTVCTYLQQRAGISYFYPKRKVLEHEVYNIKKNTDSNSSLCRKRRRKCTLKSYDRFTNS